MNHLLAISLACSTQCLATEASRPNIVLIVIDDLGAHDFGCTGGDLALTPAIDALAKRGVRFERAYAAGCVCSPTRASIMTGQAPARTGITDWIPGARLAGMPMLEPVIPNALASEARTIAEALQAAGYATFHVGKWHLGGTGSLPTDHGFDVNVGGDFNGHPASYFFPYDGKNPSSPWRVRPFPTAAESRTHTMDEYLTDRLTDEAILLIDAAVESKKPFFLSLQHYAVHSPLQAPAAEVAEYKQILAAGGDVVRGHKNATYAAMTAAVDRSVGRVVAELDRVGQRDNTIIILTSDNGGEESATSNAPLRSAKGRLYEGGIRVPLLFAGSGIAGDIVRSVPVVSTDLYPTILALAHASTDSQMCDGQSLTGLLGADLVALPARNLYWHYPHYHTKDRRPVSAVRVGDFKLVFYWDSRISELYDLASDPSETRDLAASHAEQVVEMRAVLGQWLKETGAKVPRAREERDATTVE
ncbi:MAG: DUF4976 domain-containing protein [Phycisphaerales bacterium]|nr:DUF4976 domain-containing protein [Phycisphaerales bacterium]